MFLDKIFSRGFLYTSVIFVFLISIICKWSFVDNGSLQRTLMVHSIGKASAMPDGVRIHFSIGSLKNTSQEALLEISQKYKEILNLLENQNIPLDNLKMTNYQVTTEKEWSDTLKKSVIIGYKANKGFSFEIDFNEDFVQKIFNVLSQIKTQKESFFDFSVDFFLKDETSLKRKALEKSIEIAKEEASIMAKSAGVKLKRISSILPDDISEGSIPRQKNLYLQDSIVRSSSNSSILTIPINVQDIIVERQVTIVYDIKD